LRIRWSIGCCWLGRRRRSGRQVAPRASGHARAPTASVGARQIVASSIPARGGSWAWEQREVACPLCGATGCCHTNPDPERASAVTDVDLIFFCFIFHPMLLLEQAKRFSIVELKKREMYEF
jgi:hypothetical protein